ncbi:unnamed protein product [Mytilus coruscus]|uniref:Uncharacterized protein n=1 Tax=Mytilus coruscus TaxID=42192 RepID=A0A6J8C4W4_MYTCO|nr:unnamed protein product [Mytilus coruscus]
MMINVVFCFILVTIVSINVNGDELKLVVNTHRSTWKDAFVFCNDQTNWHQIFNDCQPASCNASSIADKIINKSKLRTQQYWIFGYVLRSPLIVNIGCFSLNASLKNSFHRGSFLFEQNSAAECSRACPDKTVNHIFMRESECLCIPEHKFREQQYKEENTGACKNPCDGNNRDLCGSATSSDGEELYSVYEVVSNQTYKEKCPNETATWYTAKQKCKEQDSQLRSYTSFSFSSMCVRRREQMFWIGNHIAERIVWANGNFIYLWTVIFKTVYHQIIIVLHNPTDKRQHTSSKRNDEAYITTVLSLVNRSTMPRYTFSEVENNQANKTLSAAFNNSTGYIVLGKFPNKVDNQTNINRLWKFSQKDDNQQKINRIGKFPPKDDNQQKIKRLGKSPHNDDNQQDIIRVEKFLQKDDNQQEINRLGKFPHNDDNQQEIIRLGKFLQKDDNQQEINRLGKFPQKDDKQQEINRLGKFPKKMTTKKKNQQNEEISPKQWLPTRDQ